MNTTGDISSAKVTINEAAKLLGCSMLYLRECLKDEKHEYRSFGNAKQLGSNRWTYHINRNRLMKYINGDDMKTVVLRGRIYRSEQTH